ncbi:hypothetical protein [Dankookia sp. P2]|uniref:hypothetical protein n=1 Tax=Dankookia sp. P2 TaxID=3423955 RepID=UPI003D666578
MADFVIVVAALAGLASASPAVPGTAPTIGFKTYATVESCEEAAVQLQARPGTRLVCLPVETQAGELASAY